MTRTLSFGPGIRSIAVAGLACLAGGAAPSFAEEASGYSLTYESDVARVAGGWKHRIVLVVADGGPCRVPLDQAVEDPKSLYRKRRVGCAVYLGERRLLLTTASVVRANRDVEIFNERGFRSAARVLGTDSVLDVALLEAAKDLPETEHLPELEIAGDVPRGAECLVLGNAYGHSFSAVLGTVGDHVEILQSGLPVQVLRVNAAFFPGDSGGAVLDWQGKLVGIITAISDPGRSGGASRGVGRGGPEEAPGPLAGDLGFAVPAEQLDRAWRDLRDHGRVRRGFLGVTMSMGRQDDAGARILSVLPGSPAERAGIRAGDVVTVFGRNAVMTPRQLRALVASSSPGMRLDVQFHRGRMERYATVELTESIHTPGGAIDLRDPAHDPANLAREPLPLSPTTPTPVTTSGR